MQNLLDHPEIIATAENVQEETETVSWSRQTIPSVASSLNYKNGLASTVMADILQNLDREIVCQQTRNNQQEVEQALQILANHKKRSAGVVFKAGKAWLGPDVLAVQLERKRMREEKEQEQQDKQRVEMEKKRQAYKKAWGKVSNLPPSQWTASQLWALISYKKWKDDMWPQLKTRAQMMKVWDQIKDRNVDEMQVRPMGNDESKASAALLALIGGDKEDEVIEEVIV
jgi:hypothetical protein